MKHSQAINDTAPSSEATETAMARLIEQAIRAAVAPLAAQVSELQGALQRAPVAPANEPSRASVLRSQIETYLAANGHATTIELIKATGGTKAAVHYNVGVLETEGRCVVVRGKRGSNGRRGPDVVYHTTSIAI